MDVLLKCVTCVTVLSGNSSQFDKIHFHASHYFSFARSNPDLLVTSNLGNFVAAIFLHTTSLQCHLLNLKKIHVEKGSSRMECTYKPKYVNLYTN